MKWITHFLCLNFLLMASHAEDGIKPAMVKIYCISNSPDYYNPWSMKGPRSSTGSGVIIDGKRILTNAHVISNRTYIQVRRFGQAQRIEARVLAVSHHADLALLTVDEPGFFEGVKGVALGELPETQEDVLVYGFPRGGDTLSTTKGVVSRVEHIRYAHSSLHLLAGQIDNAINPGNSGGPVVSSGKIAGVVMQTLGNSDNIGYMVPVMVVKHFLRDLDDGRYDGFPSLGIKLQDMENPDLRRKYKVNEETTGVLITLVLNDSPADGILQPGDVMTHLENYDIANDATIEFRPNERTSLSFAVQQYQLGETVKATVLREGREREVEIALSRISDADLMVANEQYDLAPAYFVYGGLVFCPLSKNLLKEWGSSWYNNAPKHLVAEITNNTARKDKDEIVVLLKVLASSLNQGYHTLNMLIVEEANGISLRGLKHLSEISEDPDSGEFLELKTHTGRVLVLDRKKAEETKDKLLQIYRIKKDRGGF
ncbi:MAG: serine protease [Verrucomicrobiota bacterium]